MKSIQALIGGAAALASLASADRVKGFDISHYQPTVDFKQAYSDGARFVFIKATEGTSYIDPSFSDHYTGATSAGFIRGGYHFARPDASSGAAQANYFISHGGGWTSDGITLPGMLDIEWGPNSDCYGLSASSMVSWISDFIETYHTKLGVYPIIYTNYNWWTECTGNSGAFASKSPINLASYTSSEPPLPSGYTFWTFWQYNDKAPWGGDSDYFNGPYTQLQKIAKG